MAFGRWTRVLAALSAFGAAAAAGQTADGGSSAMRGALERERQPSGVAGGGGSASGVRGTAAAAAAAAAGSLGGRALQAGGSGAAIQTAVLNPALDRIDQRALPLNATFYYDRSGVGVDIVVMDSGVYAAHNELRPRVDTTLARNFVSSEGGLDSPLTVTDPWSSGTFCASQAAGSVNGVAYESRIIPLRFIDRNGAFTGTDALAALEYAMTLPAITRRRTLIVFGGQFDGVNEAFDAAVDRAVAAGIPFFTAGGNTFLTSSCGLSPVSAAGAFAVGATNITLGGDVLASFSAAGPCLDLLAPGTQSVGADVTGPDDYATWSGTAFSACIVSGVAATMLEMHPEWTPAQLYSALTTVATKGAVNLAAVPPALRASTVNALLYSVPGGLIELTQLLRGAAAGGSV